MNGQPYDSISPLPSFAAYSSLPRTTRHAALTLRDTGAALRRPSVMTMIYTRSPSSPHSRSAMHHARRAPVDPGIPSNRHVRLSPPSQAVISSSLTTAAP